MLHSNRVWCVAPVESAEDLARKVTETTWCGCTAFELSGYAWLNNATSPDGAQDFAVIRLEPTESRFVQVESITFSWCNYERAVDLIQHTLRGAHDDSDFAHEVSPVLQTPAQHGRCLHCA